MLRNLLIGLALLAAPAGAVAQAQVAVPVMTGTRLDVVATGDVERVPDLAVISAGVVTQAVTASEAIRLNAARMARVRSALSRAGIADRDIQTSSISLNPEYRYVQNQAPRLTGYQAMNTVSVRFRDIAVTGNILDALVAEGANQINGPMWTIDRPEEALDEARAAALANGRRRAEIYARALGMRVKRILSVSEAGMSYVPPPMVGMVRAVANEASAQTRIDPGEQRLTASLTISFELE